MSHIVTTLYLLIMGGLMGCSTGSKPTVAWSRYVDACAIRVENDQHPFCTSFPYPPGGKDKSELVGALMGAAQDVGELAIPIILGKEALN